MFVVNYINLVELFILFSLSFLYGLVDFEEENPVLFSDTLFLVISFLEHSEDSEEARRIWELSSRRNR